LKVTSAGNISLAQDDPDYIRQRFEIARNLGLSMMVCIPTHSNIRTVEKFVKEYDIRIAIHNHGPEQKDFPNPQSVLEVVHDMDPRVGLCVDIGHTARTGVDVVESIALAGRRLFDMHVKDLGDFTKIGSQCDVGEGLMPFPAIFKQLKKMNYQGCVNLEYEINPKDPLPGVLRSMFYMRGVLAGLGAA
jgi:sugar phosphate isomerase/epimerase